MRVTTVTIYLFLAFTVFISNNLEAMSWPCENAVLLRNFGSNEKGKPTLGMVFYGNTEVLAAESGEVIFSRSSDNNASRLPSPLGAWTAIDHGDGLISIYSRYSGEPAVFDRADDYETYNAYGSSYIEKSQPIAVSGISGWSTQDGFYFIVYDRRERRWINPAMIVTPSRNTSPLQILSVELLNTQGVPVSSRNLTQGRYTIYVDTTAAPSARTPAAAQQPVSKHAPQRIVCSVNGAEAGSLNFEAVSARDGILMVYRNGLVPVERIYSHHPAFETADVYLSRGQVNIEVIVQDAAGNTSSVVNRLIVN